MAGSGNECNARNLAQAGVMGSGHYTQGMQAQALCCFNTQISQIARIFHIFMIYDISSAQSVF